MSRKIVVVAAWEPELTRFRELCRSAELGTETIEPVGVGLVDAAARTAALLGRASPAGAFFIGTAGAFSQAAEAKALSVGDVAVVEQAILTSGDIDVGSAQLPAPMVSTIAFDAGLVSACANAGAKRAHAANTLGVTVDDLLASALSARATIEHLEAFAFARACALANVPCAVVLGIANEVGSRGREQWLANHDAASARAAEVVFRALSPQG